MNYILLNRLKIAIPKNRSFTTTSTQKQKRVLYFTYVSKCQDLCKRRVLVITTNSEKKPTSRSEIVKNRVGLLMTSEIETTAKLIDLAQFRTLG